MNKWVYSFEVMKLKFFISSFTISNSTLYEIEYQSWVSLYTEFSSYIYTIFETFKSFQVNSICNCLIVNKNIYWKINNLI